MYHCTVIELVVGKAVQLGVISRVVTVVILVVVSAILSAVACMVIELEVDQAAYQKQT